MTKAVVGVFKEREDVERAVAILVSEGYRAKDFLIVIKKNPLEAQWIKANTGVMVHAGELPENLTMYTKHIMKGAIVLIVPSRENQLELVRMVFDESNATETKDLSYAQDANALWARQLHQNFTLTVL